MEAPVVAGAAPRWRPQLPDELRAEICAVLAIAAYRAGDGALAQVALDRCLRARPRHRLGELLRHGIDAGFDSARAGRDPADNGQLARDLIRNRVSRPG